MALHRMQQYKQKRMSATVKGMEDAADQLEHRIVEQEDAIHTMENRNYFSLYCLQMETQLIHANMEMLVVMFRNFTDLEIKKHNEVSTDYHYGQQNYHDGKTYIIEFLHVSATAKDIKNTKRHLIT